MVICSSFHWNDLEDTFVYCFRRGYGSRRLKELECFLEAPLEATPSPGTRRLGAHCAALL